MAKSEQIRFRVDGDEKALVEAAAKAQGFESVSEYIRALVLQPSQPEPAAILDAADEAHGGPGAPSGGNSGAGESGAAVDPPAPAAAPEDFEPEPDLGYDPSAILEEAVAAPPPPVPVAPGPRADETFERFVERRRAELRIEGRSALVAVAEAEAEWRDSLAETPAPPEPHKPGEARTETLPGERPREDIGTGHGFCPHCGAPGAGTPFCANCGKST